MPSIYMYNTWYYTTLLGQHRRICQLFRYWEPTCSLLFLLFMSVVDFWSYYVNVVFCHLTIDLVRYCFGLLIVVVTSLVVGLLFFVNAVWFEYFCCCGSW